MSQAIQSLVILGGGSAGWMAAALLAKRFSTQHLSITLVDSSDIGAIGVGEATVPVIKNFLNELEISEQDFIQATQATFKLGIDFIDWEKPGTRFFHPFASPGAKIAKIPFHHYWAANRRQHQSNPIDTYSLAAQMARQHKFYIPDVRNPSMDVARFNYAYHFDAGLFANYLRHYAKQLGVIHRDGKVRSVTQHPDTGFITSLELENGDSISGDFFIDCSGFKALLIEDTLKTGYCDWSEWLRCDSAIAMPSSGDGESAPYTKSTAMNAGWRWEIPLQHRTGNGYVYSSRYTSHEQATALLSENIKGKALAAPKLMSFTPGTRKKAWNKNVFALGLASGFLEPLESTSIYLVQACLDILYFHFPQHNQFEKLAEKANQLVLQSQEKLRDFIILHYCLNQRYGEPFWDDCRQMTLPESLQARIDEYLHTANLTLDELDFFKMNSWVSIFSGFNQVPHYIHPKLAEFGASAIASELREMAQGIQRAVLRIPTHKEFIAANCAAETPYQKFATSG